MENIMSESGAVLQTYNQELVKCIEEMKIKRNEIIDIIHKEEAEKGILEKNLETLQNRLVLLNRSLEYNKNIHSSYDKTIKEAETKFKKIVESSQSLLQSVQQETNRLDYGDNPKEVFTEYVPIDQFGY